MPIEAGEDIVPTTEWTAPTSRGNSDPGERWRKEREAEEREELGEEVDIPPQREPEDRATSQDNAAVGKFLDNGIARLDVIRPNDAGVSGAAGNNKPVLARSGAAKGLSV